MNTLVSEGIIDEMECGSDFAYVLNYNKLFLPTEYKVLQHQNSNGFIRCMKTTYNGKVQIYYLLEGLRSLEEMVSSLTPSVFMTIAAELLNSIIAIKGNGFLSCRNVDISFNRIYVESGTNKVKIVYLPVKNGFFDDDIMFENSLRTRLIKTIQNNPNLKSDKTNRFMAELSDGAISLEALSKRMKGHGGSSRPTEDFSEEREIHDQTGNNNKEIEPEKKEVNKCLVFKAINAPEEIEFVIKTGDFIIGKNAAVVDGVISFNGAISRKHCKISKTQQGYAIADLRSVNGTFINKKRLEPEVPAPLEDGDIVRLANSDFKISIE